MSKTTESIIKLRVFLPLCGFKQDQWGHFQKATETKPDPVTGAVVPLTLRIKMQDISVRVETKGQGYGLWVKFGGARFSEIEYAEDGLSVKIGRYRFTKVAK